MSKCATAKRTPRQKQQALSRKNASADTQSDVNLCVAAFKAQTSYNAEKYCLKFEKKSGFSRHRLVRFEAHGKGCAPDFEDKCILEKSHVVALYSDAGLFYGRLTKGQLLAAAQ